MELKEQEPLKLNPDETEIVGFLSRNVDNPKSWENLAGHVTSFTRDPSIKGGVTFNQLLQDTEAGEVNTTRGVLFFGENLESKTQEEALKNINEYGVDIQADKPLTSTREPEKVYSFR